MKDLERVLTEEAPGADYFRIPHNRRSVLHWGQRKLMLSEIEFLTKFYPKSEEDRRRVVVYAGAAPGTHIPYLAELFPRLCFHLIDPAPFHENVRTSTNSKIKYENAFFLDETAPKLQAEYPNSDFLFISDIRTGDPKVAEAEEVEQAVVEDMKLQARCAEKLEAMASMHKFRLPWGDGISNYPRGDIYLPVWGPETTTESRLIVEGKPVLAEYDNRRYEKQMFFFNTTTRVQYYQNPLVNRVPGMDHCFDCASECFLLMKFAKEIERLDTDAALKRAETISVELNRQCSTRGGRTLQSRVSAKQRVGWFEGRLYDKEGGSIETRPNTHRDADQSKPLPVYRPRSIKYD